MILFNEHLLAESLTTVAPFYMTDDTQIPTRVTAAFNIEGTDYIFLFEKFLSEGLYKIEIIQMAGKTKRYWKFKNANHIRIAFATAMKAFEASVPFLGTQVKGIAMPIPATLEKAYVKLAQLLLAKTYLANQFDYLPIDHTKSKFQYLMMIRKGQLAKNIFTAKYFKDYDFSAFDFQTKSMKNSTFGSGKGFKSVNVPGAAIEKIKPVVQEKTTYTLKPSLKFSFNNVEFEDQSGVSDHKALGINVKNEKKIIVDAGDIAHEKSIWQADQEKKKKDYDEYLLKKQKYDANLQSFIDKKYENIGSVKHKTAQLNSSLEQGKTAKAETDKQALIEKLGNLFYVAAPGRFILYYKDYTNDFDKWFAYYGYSFDPIDFAYDAFFSNFGTYAKNHGDDFKSILDEKRQEAVKELQSLGFKLNKDSTWDFTWPKEVSNIYMKKEDWSKVYFVAARIAHSTHLKYDKFAEMSDFKEKTGEEAPAPSYYDPWETFQIPSNKVFKHEKAVDIDINEFELIDSQKNVLDTTEDGVIEYDYGKYSSDKATEEVKKSKAFKHYKNLLDNNEIGFDAIYDYTGGGFESINKTLRKKFEGEHTFGKDSSSNVIKMSKAYAQLIPLDIPLWVYRNTSIPGIEIPEKTLEVGEVIVDAAFLSTSLRPEVFDGGNTRFMIYVPKGSIVAPVLSTSQHPSEKEILLPALSALKVVEVLIKGNKQYVKCIYLGNGMNDFIEKSIKNKKQTMESKIMNFKEFIMENKKSDKDVKVGKGVFAAGADNLSNLDVLRKGAQSIKSGKIKLDKAPNPSKKRVDKHLI